MFMKVDNFMIYYHNVHYDGQIKASG
jgi:hypothetical protein